ncbi:hypothetical protein ACTFIV_010321 [Dictyostelium citrinum]
MESKITKCPFCVGDIIKPQKFNACGHLVCLECMKKIGVDDQSCECPVCEINDKMNKIDRASFNDEIKNYCPSHQKNYYAICKDCIAPVCPQCLNQLHTDHAIINPNDTSYLKEVRNKLIDNSQNTSNLKLQIKTSMDKIVADRKQLIGYHNLQNELIHHKTLGILKAIQTFENSLIEQNKNYVINENIAQQIADLYGELFQKKKEEKKEKEHPQ